MLKNQECSIYIFFFFLQTLKYPIHKDELHKFHLQQADKHFTEERVRDMEMQARRLRLHRRSASISSDVAPSEISDMT